MWRSWQELTAAQAASSLPFRLVLHFGPVFLGGMPTMGDAILFGPEVNFTFRMERLASTLGVPRILSEPAKRKIEPHATPVEIGRHPMPGFDGEFLFFSL